jgi:hypothetical protein
MLCRLTHRAYCSPLLCTHACIRNDRLSLPPRYTENRISPTSRSLLAVNDSTRYRARSAFASTGSAGSPHPTARL